MTDRKVIISGPLSDFDMSELLALVRGIDDRHPTAVFHVTVVDVDATTEAAEAMLREGLPFRADRSTEFTTSSYRDDRFAERKCDNCHKLYRGPAVYCSHECAILDA
jgi:hypothetical protein